MRVECGDLVSLPACAGSCPLICIQGRCFLKTEPHTACDSLPFYLMFSPAHQFSKNQPIFKCLLHPISPKFVKFASYYQEVCIYFYERQKSRMSKWSWVRETERMTETIFYPLSTSLHQRCEPCQWFISKTLYFTDFLTQCSVGWLNIGTSISFLALTVISPCQEYQGGKCRINSVINFLPFLLYPLQFCQNNDTSMSSETVQN